MPGKVQEAEASRQSKMGKARQTTVPEVTAGLSEPNPFFFSHQIEKVACIK